MPDAITRCPKCTTSFRITEAHLKSAKGAVRCGSCLNIFNAKENLISQPKPEPKPAAPVDDEDDILISDDMGVEDEITDESQSEFEDTFFFAKSAGQHETNLFERELVQDENDQESSDDESWALNLLDDTHPSSESNNESDNYVLRKGPANERDSDDENKPSNSAPKEQPPARTSPFQIIEEDEPPAKRKPTFTIDLDEDEDAAANHYAQTAHYDDLDDEDNDAGNYQFIHSIEPEPVEFSYKTSRNWSQSKLLWLPLIALASCALVAQIAWYKFDELSTVQPYRDMYGQACSVIGCSLPPLVDRSKIKATNLVVRSHPEAAGALLVDAIIQNNANFQQSFPSLDLVFTDLQNNPVAARRISAKEYLGGELTGKTQMPVRQPVHIAIEIADPGEEAVSYFITIPD
ncbi:zinc-ribbon and DUF3426 domain-containing protein [Saccharophagus degradans]|uniref:Zinc-ribbon and DUF3426 domain-containing protein n=1 Tax=Saccharophagus degradans TaxID=86304 RepID=A0AAW7X5P5_9GAMM|nr:zinc-ribbon and DUF3426 domain-containing protein [Saccharophagus degradans]MDO6423165.1 zinc-ribbon and DUF3426 domain-containing protein [Saccharophagus degradans]MDO6607311.1 zinc-ribbon and DUF3426 domain-containing protein [Saccharophagus degradans]